MRRMYSEKELTTIINQVVGEYIEAGAFDESIADAVDAYLVEHPVDITALEGQTIAPAVVNATTSISAPVINGVTSPSVKPIYCHPVDIRANNDNYRIALTCLIFNNSATAFTLETFKAWLDNLYSQIGATIRVMISGGVADKSTSKIGINSFLYKDGADLYGFIGLDAASGGSFEISDSWNDFFSTSGTITFNDGVNKIN